MNKKILIAVDLSENSLKAVDYVAKMMECHSEVDITLLHVIREPSPDVMPDEQERRNHVEKNRAESLGLMEKAGARLTAHDIPEKNIQLKIQICSKPVTVAELILHERRSGKYGTIVVGRRGMSKKEEFLFGSISNKVVREARDCTVWVVE
ncbi:MAG: universal stress protein [Desulforhabdus sp.]|jgi:nucleotide-binding universal stress UspA family protein|nr:universal stress protein [Desulforhabdus sp.]